ncbi:hypothetical protein BDN72DRAFT_557539 [Pluteus cervinus]|uniref:Uncharacterized protein n=1 Tax=Pluteus cervinus TaxID=181527 RepID=A0ACD3B9S9_9AGAR|nr:hypothetical protein BDN72DRAFT_557539 [Pluteus cervinus]
MKKSQDFGALLVALFQTDRKLSTSPRLRSWCSFTSLVDNNPQISATRPQLVLAGLSTTYLSIMYTVYTPPTSAPTWTANNLGSAWRHQAVDYMVHSVALESIMTTATRMRPGFTQPSDFDISYPWVDVIISPVDPSRASQCIHWETPHPYA